VLQTSILFGLNDRFFAIPASQKVLETVKKGKITLKIGKDDLVFLQEESMEKIFRRPF
jgi:fumarylacetoacetate (FAA) hydrolase family protein